MTSRRELRLAEARRSLAYFTEEREMAIRRVLRCETKIKELQRKIARLEKPPAGALLAEPEIPGFLQRKREGDDKDAAAREEIQKLEAERKLAKSRGRIAKLKANKAGERAKMPLTGRAALEALK